LQNQGIIQQQLPAKKMNIKNNNGFHFIPPSFTCLKEGARKGHPDCACPPGYQHTKLLMIDILRFSLLLGR